MWRAASWVGYTTSLVPADVFSDCRRPSPHFRAARFQTCTGPLRAGITAQTCSRLWSTTHARQPTHGPHARSGGGAVSGAVAGGGSGDDHAAAAAPKPSDETERLLSLQLAIKVADLGHLGESLEVHKRWLTGLEEEFFRQGDKEIEAGLPISPLFDRSKQGVSKSQVGRFGAISAGLSKAKQSVGLPKAAQRQAGASWCDALHVYLLSCW